MTLKAHAGDDVPVETNISTQEVYSEEQNVAFTDDASPYRVEIEGNRDSTRTHQDLEDTRLEDFLSRPVKISQILWSTSVNLLDTFNPWSLYLADKRVINRLNNYNLLDARLHVKIVINGTGFHYGRAIVSYLPWSDLDFVSSNAVLVPQDLVQASQQPHIYLDPSTSTGGELVLPSFNYFNYMDVPNGGWQNMGELYYRTLTPLKHANGATDTVTVTTFAWLTDVKKSVLTSDDAFGLVAQGGGEVEEANQKGTISGPATAVAKFASSLKGVPYIGTMALATQIGASAVAGVAKLYGYCRPAITKVPDIVRRRLTSSLALTNVPDLSQKITVDAEQELTIDPAVAGISSADPMNIKEIAKRESYLTSFTWSVGATPETLLWNTRVMPTLWAESGGTAIHMPACCFAAMPFKYWRGTMRFRFQIVASAFHRGRLRLAWDPNFIDSSEYNVNYVKVVDISSENDLTVEIGNGQNISFLQHLYPGADAVTTAYSSTAYTGPANSGNGTLGVYVLNELTVPNTTINNDISVNVFVSCGDDFEVAYPEEFFTDYVFKPQSGEGGSSTWDSGIGVITESSAPYQAKSYPLGPQADDDPNLNKVFMGEAISSFRPLLKRYCHHSSIVKGIVAEMNLFYRQSAFPYFRGNIADAVHVTAAAAPYNYTNTLLLQYVTMAFSGWRGGLRWKYAVRGDTKPGDTLDVTRATYSPGALSYVLSKSVSAPGSSDSLTAARYMSSTVGGGSLPNLTAPSHGCNGTIITNHIDNMTVEVEIPYQTNFRFTPGKRVNYTGVMSAAQYYPVMDLYAYLTGSSIEMYIDTYVSVAEDFQVLFFTGMPRMYYEATIPAV